MKVVFDVDDTLWGLVSKVCSDLGIDIDLIDSFTITENEQLTKQQHKEIMEAFKQASTFSNIEWYNGIERINNLHKYGIEAWIKSNNFNSEVSLNKLNELLKVLTIPSDRIVLNIVDSSTKQLNKGIDEDVYVFVDDNPHNLASSKAHINMAIRTPWNTSDKAKQILEGTDVVYCDTLNDIIDYIICLV